MEDLQRAERPAVEAARTPALAGPDGFAAFVAARSPALLRTAVLLTADRHAAEDALQEALVRVASRWERLVGGGDPEPYVRRALYSCAVDEHRRRRRRPEQLGGRGPERPVVADDADRRLLLQQALARLTPRQRAVLVLRFYEDRTEAQTAEALGCSVSTVKSQARHALQRLRDLAPDVVASLDPRPVEVDR